MVKSEVGNQNTAVGRQALLNAISGHSNTAIGSRTMELVTTGDFNSAIGRLGLASVVGGEYNSALGFNADVDATGGSFNTCTAIGYNSNVLATNRITVGHSSIGQIGGYEPWSDLSDGRYKTDVAENVPGLDFIRLLRPVTYHVNTQSLAEHLQEDYMRDERGSWTYTAPEPFIVEARQKSSSKTRSGFIAQEVEAAAQSIGYAFNGVNHPEHERDLYSLSYSTFTVPMVKAIQELSAENESLRKTLEEYAKWMELMQGEVSTLKTQIEALRQEDPED